MSVRVPDDASELLSCCLYFTAGSLARVVTRLAEEEFKPTGLSPSHAFLLMLAVSGPGSRQKELGEGLQLAPSTVTRMVDALVQDGLVTRETEGREARIRPTAAGRRRIPKLERAWKKLYERYSAVLGHAAGDELTRRIDEAARALQRDAPGKKPTRGNS